MNVVRVAVSLLGIAVALGAGGAVRADDRDDRHHHKWRGPNYADWYAPCKYEYKAGRRGFKEEYKCGRPADGYRTERRPVVIWQPAPVPYGPYEIAPATGPYVHAVPTRSFETAQGQYCREYYRTVTIGGRPQQVYGTACYMPDGSWQIVD